MTGTDDILRDGVALTPHATLPAAALQWTFTRGGGPGGQNVNKVASRATLTVALDDLAAVLPADVVHRLRGLAGHHLQRDPDRLVITAGDSRSQLTNRASCVERLAALVQRAVPRPTPRRRTKPTRGSKQRRLDAKKARGAVKAARRQRGE